MNTCVCAAMGKELNTLMFGEKPCLGLLKSIPKDFLEKDHTRNFRGRSDGADCGKKSAHKQHR